MKKVKGLCLVLLATIVAMTMFACEPNTGKQVVNDVTNVQTVTYGAYAQTVVTDQTVIDQLAVAQWDGNRTFIGETVYEKVTATPYREGACFADGTEIEVGKEYYFTVMPIEWYVLSKSGSSVLMAKNILDVSAFSTNTETDNEGNYPNNWEYSTLRNYVNTTFANTAFGAMEFAAISTTKVVSKYPQSFYQAHASAINDTNDKVFALSYAEVVNTDNGFTANGEDYDCLRMAKVTDYAKAKGAWFYIANATEGNADYERDMTWNGNGDYWLRTVGWEIGNAGIVRYTGSVGAEYKYVNITEVGVRPAITLGYEVA